MAQEFSVTASLKGGIGETLLTKHKGAIREFFSQWCLQDLEENNPEWVPDIEYRSVFNIGRTPHSYDISIDGDFATWYPDALYTFRFEPSRRGGETLESYRVDYPVEVKTGPSSELTDNQRAVMATLEQQEKPVFPIRVRVDINELPESFSVKPYRIQHSGNTPLPEYSTGDSAKPPAQTRTQEGMASLSSFQTENGDWTSDSESLEEYMPSKIVDAVRLVSNDRETTFTVQEISAELDDTPVDEIQAAINDLAMVGEVYELEDGEWKFLRASSESGT